MCKENLLVLKDSLNSLNLTEQNDILVFYKDVFSSFVKFPMSHSNNYIKYEYSSNLKEHVELNKILNIEVYV